MNTGTYTQRLVFIHTRIYKERNNCIVSPHPQHTSLKLSVKERFLVCFIPLYDNAVSNIFFKSRAENHMSGLTCFLCDFTLNRQMTNGYLHHPHASVTCQPASSQTSIFISPFPTACSHPPDHYLKKDLHAAFSFRNGLASACQARNGAIKTRTKKQTNKLFEGAICFISSFSYFRSSTPAIHTSSHTKTNSIPLHNVQQQEGWRWGCEEETRLPNCFATHERKHKQTSTAAVHCGSKSGVCFRLEVCSLIFPDIMEFVVFVCPGREPGFMLRLNVFFLLLLFLSSVPEDCDLIGPLRPTQNGVLPPFDRPASLELVSGQSCIY